MLEPGAPVGGFGGAVWADRDNDGEVDGYVYNNQYVAGLPAGYDAALHRFGSEGALGPEVMGALIRNVPEGAVLGASVDGLSGAVWADRDNDGIVDGYVYNGQYYGGAPDAVMITPAPLPIDGERG